MPVVLKIVVKISQCEKEEKVMFEKRSLRIISLMFLSFSALLLSWTSTTAAYTIMGNVNSYQKDGYNVTFNCENGRVKLSFLRDDLVRVRMAPAGKDFPADDLHLDENGPYAVVTYTWPGVSYQISEEFDFDLEGEVYTVRAGRLAVKVRRQPFKLAFYDTEGNLLVMEKEGIVDAGPFRLEGL